MSSTESEQAFDMNPENWTLSRLIKCVKGQASTIKRGQMLVERYLNMANDPELLPLGVQYYLDKASAEQNCVNQHLDLLNQCQALIDARSNNMQACAQDNAPDKGSIDYLLNPE